MAANEGEGDEREERRVQPSSKVNELAERKKMKKKRSMLINLTHCRYDSVRRVARRCGLQPVVGDSDDWTVYWVDTSVMMERVMDMKRYQKINHFPGMGEICRKDLLGRNLTRMKKLFPKEYNIFPRTWVMPADYSDFQAYCRVKKHKTFISKPEAGCQGRGIAIFKNPKLVKPGEHCVVQQYISRPFVIDGFKFDFRVYVLVTSCDPLRVYVYKDGLGRFATIPYREPTHHNLDEACLHLTNYSINKSSDDFVRDDVSGSKRRLSTVDQWFTDNGYDINRIWASIEDVIIKTLVSAHTVLRHNYRSCFPSHTHGSACFEILGFDVLLDHKLKAWIIEVNHSPSFHTDSPLDKEVKEGLLYDTLQLIDLRATDKRRCMEEDKRRAQQRLLTRHRSKETTCSREGDEKAKYAAHLLAYEKKHMGGYRRIYPQEGWEGDDPYAKFFEQSSSLCAETAASKARMELARVQRQEIEQKAKEEETLRNKLAGGSGGGGGDGEGDEAQGEGGGKIKFTTVRRIPFRLRPEPAQRKTEPPSPSPQQPTEQETPLHPQLEAVPEAIDEQEELQRLTGLELRERLIRGLNLPHMISSMLSSPQSPPPIHTSLLPPSHYHQLPPPPPSHNLPPPPSHTLLPHRRHTSSTHHHTQPSSLLSSSSMSAGRHRPAAQKPSFSLRCGQPSSLKSPVETFGLLVTAAPVANRRHRLEQTSIY